MDMAQVVFEHACDEAVLAQIDTLRTVRLNLAENMLRNLATTHQELKERGLVDAKDKLDLDELRHELQQRIATLRQRLAQPKVVFVDEIDLYTDLLGDDEDDLAD